MELLRCRVYNHDDDLMMLEVSVFLGALDLYIYIL